MLTLGVVPGKSGGFWQLGMPLGQALAVIEEHKTRIAHCDIKFHLDLPTQSEIVLDLNEDGILLRFDPTTQRLTAIEFYRLDRVALSYNNSSFR
jgi:hypothetical protein